MAGDMQEKRSQLNPETAQRLTETLASQEREAFSHRLDMATQLTKTNFITNGSAAVAVLAYIGSGHAPFLMLVPLALFSLGVVATGVQQRALLAFYGALFDEARRRLRGFLADELTVAQVVEVKVNTSASRTDRLFGWVAQGSFVVGIIVAALVIVLCSPASEPAA